MQEEITQFQLSSGKTLLLLFLSTIVYGIFEFLYLYFFKKTAKLKEYRTTFFGLAFALLVSIGITSLYGRINTAIIGIWASKFAFFQTDLTWYWWLYGLLVYEFFYWIQHYLAHKVRLFWCLHSPHHAPESMNMFVGFNHSFLESLFYMPFFLGFFPALLGVNPMIIMVWNMVDSIWGSMIHVSDKVVKGKLGFLEYLLQTPAYHRAHHAQNVLYMDMNYCSITLFWDWVFRTLQPLKTNEPVRYGITRGVNTNNFLDVHFGEFRLLWKDMTIAPSFKNKLLYLVMPPGWAHNGELKTASHLKKQILHVKT
jgi:sterol desaturase/sphingolipid hydroxylase (fatty acid hydroxylase superfamily)